MTQQIETPPPIPNKSNPAIILPNGQNLIPRLRPMQGPRRHLRQLCVPKVPLPMLRKRRRLGAQGVGQRRRRVEPDQGAARARGPGATAAEFQARQGLQRDRLLHAQPRPRHPRVVYVRHHGMSGSELHRREPRYEAEPEFTCARQVPVLCAHVLLLLQDRACCSVR